MSEKEHDRKCWNCEFDDFCSWTAAGEGSGRRRKGSLAEMINGELIVDNFAGGGGASTGIEMATGYSVDIAINHDPEAIKMHKVTV